MGKAEARSRLSTFPTALGKPANPAGFPHSHSFDGGSLFMRPEPQDLAADINPGVGQIKMPKWAKYSCQKQKEPRHLRGTYADRIASYSSFVRRSEINWLERSR